MASLRVVSRWIFVRGPAAFHELAESGSWLVGAITLGAPALGAGVGGGIGALVGLLRDADVAGGALVGAAIGLGAVLAWGVLSMVALGVLWVRGISPAEVLAGRQSGSRRTGAAGWRRPGEPLVPLSLAGFFALMAVIFAFSAVSSWHNSRPWDDPTALADGRVVEVYEPGLLEKGSGSVLIQYTVDSRTQRIEVDRDPGEHFLHLDDVLPIEYSVARPARARAVWVVESERSDATFDTVVAAICGALGIASAADYVVGRWRRR